MPLSPVRRWLHAWLPAPPSIGWRERLRGPLGVLLGLALTAMTSRWMARPLAVHIWMLAPIGASAVLVFTAPANPLAQPWAVVAGNTLSAAIGVLCAMLIPDPVLAVALAPAAAIAAMVALRCPHPPGGAMAALAVLSHASGAEFSVSLAGVNSLVLVLFGCAYNPLTGHAYPLSHRAPAPDPTTHHPE